MQIWISNLTVNSSPEDSARVAPRASGRTEAGVCQGLRTAVLHEEPAEVNALERGCQRPGRAQGGQE